MEFFHENKFFFSPIWISIFLMTRYRNHCVHVLFFSHRKKITNSSWVRECMLTSNDRVKHTLRACARALSVYTPLFEHLVEYLQNVKIKRCLTADCVALSAALRIENAIDVHTNIEQEHIYQNLKLNIWMRICIELNYDIRVCVSIKYIRICANLFRSYKFNMINLYYIHTLLLCVVCNAFV